jgi:capsular exopolysaccharide synthesis family protein
MIEDRSNSSEGIDFRKYWLILKRQWLPVLGIPVIVVGATTVALLFRSSSYIAEGKLMFKSNRTTALTGLPSEAGFGQLEALGYQNNPRDTQAEIITSIPVLEATIQQLDLKNQQGKSIGVEDFAKRLQVKGVPGTDVLQIIYKDQDPRVAAAVVNKVMEIYLQENVKLNRAEATSAGDFIAVELPKTEAAVRQADLALRQFKEANNVIDLKQEASESVTSIATLDQQLSQLKSQLAGVTAQQQGLQEKIKIDPQNALRLSTLSQIPAVQEVLTEYQKTQQQLAVERARFNDQAPVVQSLRQKNAELETLLQERVAQSIGAQQLPIGSLQLGDTERSLIQKLIDTEVERLGLAERYNALVNVQSFYKKRASVLPQLEQTQKELERRQTVAQTTYSTLLSRLQEIQVAKNQNVGNAQIISPAIPPHRSSGQSKPLILGLATVAGALLGLATAFILDLMNRSVKTLKEAKELFGYTVLGTIPNFYKGESSKNEREPRLPRIITRDTPHAAISDAYRMLQANLKFLNSDKALKTIVVTSSVAKEGKSEISANLATVMAQAGRRVLLVDADMRHPIQHHIWDIINAAGLSNILVNQTELDQVTQEVMPNLFILPSGTIPPNPVAILDSKRMSDLIQEFAHHYDFVIFDAPPLVGIVDPVVLGKMTDGILLVVRPGIVSLNSAKTAKEFLTQSGQTVLGMVVNGVNVKDEPDSYFYFAGESKIEELPQLSSRSGY